MGSNFKKPTCSMEEAVAIMNHDKSNQKWSYYPTNVPLKCVKLPAGGSLGFALRTAWLVHYLFMESMNTLLHIKSPFASRWCQRTATSQLCPAALPCTHCIAGKVQEFTETCASPADRGWDTAADLSSTDSEPGTAAADRLRPNSTHWSPCSPPAGSTWTESTWRVTPTPEEKKSCWMMSSSAVSTSQKRSELTRMMLGLFLFLQLKDGTLTSGYLFSWRTSHPLWVCPLRMRRGLNNCSSWREKQRNSDFGSEWLENSVCVCACAEFSPFVMPPWTTRRTSLWTAGVALQAVRRPVLCSLRHWLCTEGSATKERQNKSSY